MGGEIRLCIGDSTSKVFVILVAVEGLLGMIKSLAYLLTSSSASGSSDKCFHEPTGNRTCCSAYNWHE